MIYLFFLLILNAQAATVILRVDTTATQALVWVQAPTASSCTVQASEDASLSPLVDDVNPALFTNAHTEAVRTAESFPVGTDTLRKLRIGLRFAALASDGYRHSRSLAANTYYYLSVACDATVTSTFHTLSTSGIEPEGPPIDSTASFGNLAFPEFTDFIQPVVEPHSGMKIYSADPNSWGSSRPAQIQSVWPQGGSGWTGSIVPYSTGAGATTGNTNQLFIPLEVAQSETSPPNSAFNDQLRAIGGYWYDNWTDLALDLHGVGAVGPAADRKLCARFTYDSGQTFATSCQFGTLPPTTPGDVTIPNITDGSAANYPAAYFKGWGVRVQRKWWPRVGRVTVASSVVTLTKAGIDTFGGTEAIGASPYSDNAYFDKDWVVGTKIYIAGSSAASSGACVNDFCTIASVTNFTSLTISESLPTLAERFYESAAFGVVINKVNAISTVTFSARFRIAKSYPSNNGFNGGMALATATSSDGITGYPGIFPNIAGPVARTGAGSLYFIGTSGPGSPVIRFISPFSSGSTCSQGTDCPTGNNLGPAGPQFDESDSTKIYLKGTSIAGKASIFMAQYGGRGGNPLQMWLPYNNTYASGDFGAPPTTELTLSNLTPGGNDIDSQITAHVPSYNTTFFGAAGGASVDGVVGPFMVMHNGGQNNVCWIHIFCVTNVGPCALTGAGKWYKSYRLDDSTSGGTDVLPSGLFRYSGAHAVSVTVGSSAVNGYSLQISTHEQQWGTPSTYEGGPYQTIVASVKRGGVFVPVGSGLGTALPWPIDSTYDNTCPGGLPAWITAHGAVGNQCVTVRGQLPCSAYAGVPEAADRPCPYNSAYSWLGGLKVGDFLKDYVLFGIGDNEGFMAVTAPILVSGSTYELVLQRDANPSYCTFQHDGVQNPAQLQHADGWGFTMWPRDACSGGTIVLVDIVNDTGSSGNQNTIRGHGSYLSVGPNSINRVASGALTSQGFVYNIQNNRAWNTIDTPKDGSTPSSPLFAGYGPDPYQSTQSYVDAKQASALPFLKNFAFDFSHPNPAAGAELEYPGSVLGAPTNLTLQAGTTGVYKMTVSGTVDLKHQAVYAWAGTHFLIDVSNPTTSSHQITDSVRWRQCYALNNGECRTGSTAGDFFISIPSVDILSSSRCWCSQMNVIAPCAFAGPTQLGQARMIWIGSPDGGAKNQIYLGSLLMGPEQQQVYSSFLPTPDGLYGIYVGIDTSGYHTGLLMAKLPTPVLDTVNRNTFIPIKVDKSSGTNVKIRFWYDETLSGACTTRAEACYATTAAINETTPFYFNSDSFSTQSGAWTITIPALPGKLLYYRIVDNAVEGTTKAVLVN